jgi:hypothetical protein
VSEIVAKNDIIAPRMYAYVHVYMIVCHMREVAGSTPGLDFYICMSHANDMVAKS